LDWKSDPNNADTEAAVVAFAPLLERWYDRHRRDLPWRHTTDPYRIWLSEVILQQTRVAQGMPYYLRFVDTYPTVVALARADERELLRLWQGLGYYSRARNLHQTAKLIADELGGQFPVTYAALLKLKGIGTYTAAAVASFAFGERVPVVDGNVYRVLARAFGITDDITTTTARKTFAALAARLIAHATDPATYNQAIMEFGAIQCTPTSPDCLLCPLQQSCVAYLTGRQQQLPVKKKKVAVRERYFTYFVFRQGDGNATRFALRERTGRDIWQNLYEFYGLETDEPAPEWPGVYVPDAVRDVVAGGTQIGPAIAGQQLLSHQRVRAFFYEIVLPTTLPAGTSVTLPDGLRWFSLAEIEELPKPVLITSFFRERLG
jgi:A/G-specific adenine glycosylase